jgi:hypothetical protein
MSAASGNMIGSKEKAAIKHSPEGKEALFVRFRKKCAGEHW